VARDTNVDRIVCEENCGLVVTYGDVAELEEALQRVGGEVELGQQLGRNARKAYESTYAWSNMKSRLLRLYQEVVQ
jgi:glycosyltransferase involved in cell wall biosynthesis